jgi:hypothetical protein
MAHRVILRAAKQYRLELEFLEAFSAKFFDGNGKRYRNIAERVEKSRAILDVGRRFSFSECAARIISNACALEGRQHLHERGNQAGYSKSLYF